MDIDQTLLKQVLVWIVGGGGAAALTFYVFENVKKLAALAPKPKRYASLGIAAVLAVVAYAATVGLNYSDAPAGWQGWLEALFAVAFVAVFGSQGLHGMRKLGNGGG